MGSVFNIQRYSIHDGPGIRTVVFLKGCTLGCQWCANPESIHGFREVMFSPEKCIGCGLCVGLASNGEVEKDAAGTIVIHRERIRPSDLEWAEVCPSGALTVVGRRRGVQDVMNEVARDSLFFDRSGGGVTFSGGEPLLQPSFVASAAREAHRRGFNTVVETCGAVPLRAVECVINDIDLFLCDLKVLDPTVHQIATGGTNLLVRQTIEWISQQAPGRICVRTPLVPGVTMSLAQIDDNVAFLRKVGVRHYDVLPFHRLGSSKYAGLGLIYACSDMEPPPSEEVVAIRQRIRAAGLNTEFPEISVPDIGGRVLDR